MLSSMTQQSMMPPFARAGASQQVTSPTGDRFRTGGLNEAERGESGGAAEASVIGSQSQQQKPLPVRGSVHIRFFNNITFVEKFWF